MLCSELKKKKDKLEMKNLLLVSVTSARRCRDKNRLAQVKFLLLKQLMCMRARGQATITFDPHFAGSQISPHCSSVQVLIH